jgi:hypothetical protein
VSHTCPWAQGPRGYGAAKQPPSPSPFGEPRIAPLSPASPGGKAILFVGGLLVFHRHPPVRGFQVFHGNSPPRCSLRPFPPRGFVPLFAFPLLFILSGFLLFVSVLLFFVPLFFPPILVCPCDLSPSLLFLTLLSYRPWCRYCYFSPFSLHYF